MNPTQEKRINQILKDYNKEIVPLIVTLEVTDGEYPVEVMDEIRAMMNHLANISLISDSLEIDREIEKIFSHYKRALLDCYKYLCISEIDNYNHFCKQYRFVDLTLVDNGDFSKKISEMYCNARDSTIYAKKSENNPNTGLNEVLKNYKDAYTNCVALMKYVEENSTKIENIRHKPIYSTTFGIAGFAVGVIGALIGILGLIF